jgi:AcrR family transcriptional regulator
MGKKRGLSQGDVVEAATAIADRDGLEAASLTAVASELGIKTPSLYNHVGGLADLRRLLSFRAAAAFKEVVVEALEGHEGADALRSIAKADRKFAVEHPGLYDSFLPAPTPESDEELYNAMAEPIFMIAYVLLDMGIPQEKALHLMRAMRALLHGYLDLEAKGGFGPPVEIDASFEASVELMIAGIEAVAAEHA